MSEKLSESEEKFLKRQIRNKDKYYYFSLAGIVVAALLCLSSVSSGTFDSKTFVLMIIILLHARGNLKQHKDANLLSKLSSTK